MGAYKLNAVAHGLAVAAFLWLLLWPSFYQGVSVSPVAVLEGAQPSPSNERHFAIPKKRFSASLIEENGLWVIPLLLAPVILTGLGLLMALYGYNNSRAAKWVLWVAAIVLLAFCLLAIFSIGPFFLPAAIAFIIAAAKTPGHKPQSRSTTVP